MSTWSLALIVLRMELRQLVRDKRALFSAILLPALLYPVMLSAGDGIEDLSKRTLSEREVLAAVDFSEAPAELAEEARALLEAQAPIVLRTVDASSLRDLGASDRDERNSVARGLLEAQEHILVHATSKDDGRTVLHLYYDVKESASREGRERAQRVFGELADSLAIQAREELLGGDPAAGLEPLGVDISTASARAGEERGRFLPLIAVMILISGGAYAALAVFAGEREAGTLETLLVQPVPARSIALGKYTAVVIASMVTLGANMASLAICAAAGLIGGDDAQGGGIGAADLLAGLVYLPATFLLAALLCLFCGRARTFREGQQILLPLMMATALPSALSMRGDLEHSALLAMIPFGGAALSLRDALRGSLTLVPTLTMAVSHLLYTGIAISRIGGILDAEKVLSTSTSESESVMRRLAARHAQRWAFGAVLAVYLVGGKLQTWNLQQGLLLTLLVMLPLLAVACARWAPRREPMLAELGLRRPKWMPTLGGLLCIPALVLAMGELGILQQRLLPIPEAMTNMDALAGIMGSLSSFMLVLMFAVAPGIGEELFFRGAVTSALRRDLTPMKTVLIQAAFFAGAHASIYRLAPTFLVGLFLGGLRLRTGSLLACVLVHTGYNAMLTLDAADRWKWSEQAWGPHLAWLAIPGLILLARGARREV
ncbi:MAG: sodium transport system permease protein [Planctomycetota bacterium]|jgi:sodium transport system permease protein